jgi:putative methyltransferase
VPLYTELILGLPGETLETWKQNFYTLFDAGNHNGITVFQLQVLENTELNLLQKKLYGIETSMVYDYIQGSDVTDEILEGILIVIGTKDMPKDKMLDAQIFTWFIMTFHINGLTSYISQFLKKYKNVEYSEFYEKLYNFIKNDSWFQKEEIDTRMYFLNWMAEGITKHPKLNNVNVAGVNLLHRTTMNMHTENKYEHIMNLIDKFLELNYPLDKEIKEQLLDFQNNYIIKYQDIKNYPKTKKYDYDFLDYLDDKELENNVTYNFDFPEEKTTSFPRFLDNIYYQRRRNYGKALIKKITNDGKQSK